LLLLLIRIYLIISQQNSKTHRIGDQLLAKKYKIKKIDINFGQQLYPKLKVENRFQFLPNLFSKSPENGINYCVNYIDTKGDEEVFKKEVEEGVKQVFHKQEVETITKEETKDFDREVKRVLNQKIIVLLHGIPGTVFDFEEFAEEFGEKYRLIIPQMPDFELSRKTEQFWHSNEERVDFLLTFLRALNIKEVDCLFCHSGGSVMALQIISELHSQLVVKSLVMITSPGIKWLNSYQLKNSRYGLSEKEKKTSSFDPIFGLIV
jgi:hypothetical protein